MRCLGNLRCWRILAVVAGQNSALEQHVFRSKIVCEWNVFDLEFDIV